MSLYQGKGGPGPSSGDKSAPQNTSVGSGSRPTPSRIKIDSSAPADMKNLGGRGNVPEKLGGK